MSLIGAALAQLDNDKLLETYHKTLDRGLHGICFSPYLPEQEPGDPLSEEQIQQRLDVIRPHTQWIRSFSCTEGNQAIPRIAKEKGLKTLVGAWLSDEKEKNKEEIENVVEIARQGYADIVAVGNEVLYREELEEDELLPLIQEVKEALPDTPVGYVDAYYEFSNRPALADACDVILANCYPYWEGCSIDYSLLYAKEMYRQAQSSAPGKRVIITESGWPSQGAAKGAAVPSMENARRYFIDLQTWAKEESLELFYFSSFDETWKVSDEGDVGAHWGIWDTYGQLK
ncbi:MAG: glycosyl hydrolase family 17 protein [Verrucomicrobiota bacterium]